MDNLQGEDTRYETFKEEIQKVMHLEEFLNCYKLKKFVDSMFEWSEISKFSTRMEIELNPTPPIGYCLTQTDTMGYVDKERFACWLPKELGGTGETLFGETQGEAIYKAIRHENGAKDQ